MKKAISKEKILNACIEKQQSLIEGFESRVAEMRNDIYSQNQSASQSESRSAGKIELLSTQENELGFAQMEMGYLKSLDPSKKNDKVEPGAVVITNLRNFFIAVSSELLEIDGEEIFGISTRAPLYKVMEGLGAGDKFEFNKSAYEIQEVY